MSSESAASLRSVRVVVGLLIAVAIASSIILVWRNQFLLSVIRNPQQHGEQIRAWANGHPWRAHLYFVAIFVGLGSVALPVWWLQILAGFAFGILHGLLAGLLTAMVTSIIAVALSRFVFGGLLRERLRTHTERLARLDESLNHNGLLVVSGVRLAHFIPAGLSNYAFGLTRIPIRDVAVGTIVGGLPSTLSLVAIGARGSLLHDWRFIALLVILNAGTIAVLLMRYLWPNRFRRRGAA